MQTLEFFEELRQQRWDDHRYYHHSRINQALHLVSAISFVCAYVIVFFDPAAAALIGWLFSMTTRQAGHFFFEPKTYDKINHATHEHKEEIKLGYNLQRKVILLSIWALSPAVLLVDPTLFGLFKAHTGVYAFIQHMAIIWLVLAGAGLVFRTAQLCATRNVQTGLVWMTKIITDPFNDIMTYWKSPLYILKGELIDPAHSLHKHA
jgi:hypothetical protein